MRPKKDKGAKGFKQGESQKASSDDTMELTNLSSIDKASFMEGLQLNYGNPLHSTAMEEDLEERQVDKDGAGKHTVKPTSKQQRGAAVKRKKTEESGESGKEEKRKKRSTMSTGNTVSQPGKMSAKKSSAGQKSTANPVKNQPLRKRESEPANVDSGESELEEDSDSGTAPQSHRRVLSSDEEVDEDTSWKPSPKKAKMHSLGRKSSFERSKSRKSSSGSTSGGHQKPSSDKQKRKKHGRTELEVVLDAFLDFCEQYRESVESQAVKQAIDLFSTNVKDQLLEKISSYKEFKILKRENVKVGSKIHTKRQRLLNAKHELMRAERQLSTLQKEKADLELRLADLRQGQAFLHDIRELNRKYLDYRHRHPNEKQTYGASSLPALLLETRHIQVAEHQLRGNEQQDKNTRTKGTVK